VLPVKAININKSPGAAKNKETDIFMEMQ